MINSNIFLKYNTMIIKKAVFITTFIIITFAISAHADSPVWKVSKDNHHLYIGGTIHLLSEKDYRLPSAFNKAYNNSAQLVLETDLQKFAQPEFQKSFMEKMTYSGNQNIKQVLDTQTFQALKKHLSDRGVPVDTMLKYKPGMLVMVLTVIELQRFKLAGIGVDEFFNQKALTDKKKIGYLETIDEQLSFLLKMGEGNENELITQTLHDMKDLPTQMAAMKQAWRKGDNSGLEKMALTEWKKNFPDLYHTLLVKRNNNWIPKIEKMLNTKEIEFVLFGALHLVGNEGVLAQLKARGYKIQKQ